MLDTVIELKTDAEIWYERILENNYDEALSAADALLEGASEDENGCLVTTTTSPRKIRVLGVQDRAYRFVYYVKTEQIPTDDEVVRHLCHNRLCINPAHMTTGTRADNRRDDWDRLANGVDFALL